MMRHDSFDNDPAMAGAVKSVFGALNRQGGIRRRKPFVPFMVLGALAPLLGGVLWYSYPQEVEIQGTQAVPIIRADAAPYKTVPDDPGGMAIPFRESTVFDALRAQRAESGERRIESLLPPAEEPVGREALFAGLKTEMPEDVATAPAEEEVVIGAARSAAPVEAAATENSPQVPAAKPVQTAEKAQESAPAKPAVAKEEEGSAAARTEPAAGDSTRTTQETGGSHYIQLLSLRSDSDARAAWPGIQEKFSGALSGLGHRVQRADLGERGTYYRLQAGPVSAERAKQLCQNIEKTTPGGCLVVKN